MNEKYDMLREQIPHGNGMFPLMVHQVETDTCFEERIYCHWHSEIEILVITGGRGQVTIDDRSYDMKEGDVVFILSNRLHSATAEIGGQFDFFAVVFDLALLNSSVYDVIQQRYIDNVLHGKILFGEHVSPEQAWEKKLYALLLEIRDLFEEKGQGYELGIKAKLYEIWYLLCVHAVRAPVDATENADYRVALTKKLIAYIKEHYNEPISLKELAKESHLSEGHLCRFFKSMTNRSVTEYINYYRIGVSVQLLKDTRYDVGQIAGMTGFNNISYFNKVFRKYMHMTPSAFRRGEEKELE